MGAVGRPWRPDYGGRAVEPVAFAGFAEPGYAKIAWSWSVRPADAGRSRLMVAWRTATTDAVARRRFGLYWTLAGPAVRLLARVALARLRAEVTRSSTSSPQHAAP